MKRSHQIAKEISENLPTFLRHTYPYIFGAMEIPPSQVLAVSTIQEKGRCSLSELSKAMHISAPTISGIIDRLEESGYVKRIPDENDRRVTNIELTSKGEKVVQKFRQNIMNRWKTILERIPSVDQENLIQSFKKVTKGLVDGTIQ